MSHAPQNPFFPVGPRRLIAFILLACFSLCPLPRLQAQDTLPTDPALSHPTGLSPPQEVAAEILAYVLKVVLGKAGLPNQRKGWANCGLYAPLDLRQIRETLEDPDRNEFSIIALDPALLDLTRVLYHYDKTLSLFEGEYGIASIYPCPELVAIRLLILQKLRRGQKIHLQALISFLDLPPEERRCVGADDLHRAGLAPAEWTLILDIIQSKPRMLAYLQSPFLVAALYQIGVLAEDALVAQKIRKASYTRMPCTPLEASRLTRQGSIKVALIPSFTTQFRYDSSPQDRPSFHPTRLLKESLRQVRDKALQATACALTGWQQAGAGSSCLNPNEALGRLSFCAVTERPLVIHPGNAIKLMAALVPDAAFRIVLLGKKISMAIPIREGRDTYPACPWTYLDLLDVRYDQIQDAMDGIGRALLGAILERTSLEKKRPWSGRPLQGQAYREGGGPVPLSDLNLPP